MKHQAAARVQAQLAGMIRDEKPHYFRERTQALRELQQPLIKEREVRKSA